MNRIEVGHIYSVKDTIVEVSGLELVTSGEMVKDAIGSQGLVLNLEFNRTGVVMFSDNTLKAGDSLTRLHNTLSIPADPTMLGNVIDSIGVELNKINLLFNKATSKVSSEFGKIIRGVELKAPGIIVRQPVTESLETGIIGIDGALPLGRGQRELIIGDRQTGKTAIAFDVVLNQASVDVVNRRLLLKSSVVNADKNIIS